MYDVIKIALHGRKEREGLIRSGGFCPVLLKVIVLNARKAFLRSTGAFMLLF